MRLPTTTDMAVAGTAQLTNGDKIIGKAVIHESVLGNLHIHRTASLF